MKSLLIILLSLITLKAAAPDLKLLIIVKSDPLDIYDSLIRAVVKVESEGDTLALNLKEEAYGAFQIRPIRLLDYYQRTGKKYILIDCFKFKVSKEIFLYYANESEYGDFETIARSWNGSGNMTIAYWEKVQACL
jgi:hypothetical protein